MQTDTLFSFLTNAFDEQHCLTMLQDIWGNDRLFDFAAFARTAKICEEQMRLAGLADVEILPLRADGKTIYGDWPMPRAWDAHSATLIIAATGEVLADYSVIPTSLAMYSAPTPPGGIRAQVVEVLQGQSVDPASLHGKLLLTSQSANDLVALAQESGAVGIISDFFPLYPGVRDHKEQMKGHSRWDNTFCAPRNDTGLFAFNLSPEAGEKLRTLLGQGSVELQACVDTKIYDGETYVVSGAIPGETDEEVFAYGHLYEPGALDNASGCATLLELARCINAAIASGTLPRPQRTLRFVMGWECVGSTAWLLAHPDRRNNTFCGLVADMVGTESIDNTHMCLWHNPIANYGFTDTLISQLLTAHRAWIGENYPAEEKPFSIGTDNIIGDPYWGIPTVAMITEPALSYHSSMDTPQRIDPAILKRCAVLLGGYLWETANLSDTRQAELTQSALDRLRAQGHSPLVLDALQGKNPPACESSDLIPVRRTPGCLNFAGRDDLIHAPWQPSWNNRLHQPLFWADGKRTLEQITILSAAQAQEDLDERRIWINAYFRFLADNGYLSLETADCTQ